MTTPRKTLARLFPGAQSLEDAFWQRVLVVDSCWEWIGYVNGDGYGNLRYKGKNHRAYRLGYELLRGPIPEGLTLDHLCRNRRCVNPDHLEPVTNRENILRGTGASARFARSTHCVNGHPLDGVNRRGRYCKTCSRIRGAKYAAAHPEKSRARERAYYQRKLDARRGKGGA